jgi:hypothetical protein
LSDTAREQEGYTQWYADYVERAVVPAAAPVVAEPVQAPIQEVPIPGARTAFDCIPPSDWEVRSTMSTLSGRRQKLLPKPKVRSTLSECDYSGEVDVDDLRETARRLSSRPQPRQTNHTSEEDSSAKEVPEDESSQEELSSEDSSDEEMQQDEDDPVNPEDSSSDNLLERLRALEEENKRLRSVQRSSCENAGLAQYILELVNSKEAIAAGGSISFLNEAKTTTERLIAQLEANPAGGVSTSQVREQILATKKSLTLLEDEVKTHTTFVKGVQAQLHTFGNQIKAQIAAFKKEKMEEFMNANKQAKEVCKTRQARLKEIESQKIELEHQMLNLRSRLIEKNGMVEELYDLKEDFHWGVTILEDESDNKARHQRRRARVHE